MLDSLYKIKNCTKITKLILKLFKMAAPIIRLLLNFMHDMRQLITNNNYMFNVCLAFLIIKYFPIGSISIKYSS